MTEYTTSSEAIRDYMSARERTLRWVERYGAEDSLLSPSSPPSVLEDPDALNYAPSDSDCESSHSVPPRMVLRWEDGRPDVPIPHDNMASRSFPRSRGPARNPSHPPIPDHMRSQPRAIPSATSHRSRHAQTLSYVTAPPVENQAGQGHISQSPESIVVLPSRESEESSLSTPQDEHPPHLSQHTGSKHSRVPTHHSSRSVHHPGVLSPTPHIPHNPSQGAPSRSTHSPPVMYSQSQPLPMSTTGGERYLEQQAASQSRAASQLPYNYSPPAIIYAPSSKRSRPHYAPPAIVYSPPSHPHQMDGRYPPPSMAYSQSAPPPHNASAPYPDPSLAGHPRIRSHTTSSVIHEERSHHSRSQSRGRSIGPTSRHEAETSRTRSQRGRRGFFGRPGSPSRSRSPTPSLGGSDAGSDSSAGTYYILPTPGQKVQIIVPNGRSAYTATTTTAHSPHSPQSYHSPRKPFFQRIFSIPKFSTPSVDSRGSASSRGSGRKLQRRHTIGGAHLRHQHDVQK
ncbi:hypothetical protein BXZ70DRAFT_905761 [Cristinia sonorae]|uniref:Uncharacterized protein n=1 Tax=Cristinia sonorae TaxID=1940300 RepID=A0A8K0UUW1_9AGAR|nr:hypothetical protein BXZ70DRAFT_905761 [Cristinia sonorae]